MAAGARLVEHMRNKRGFLSDPGEEIVTTALRAQILNELGKSGRMEKVMKGDLEARAEHAQLTQAAHPFQGSEAPGTGPPE